MHHNIKSITIVGGGSSGWMTAAAIVKQLPGIKVTLVESPNIATIGVGESTIGHINEYLHCIGLKDEDWMKHCNATYKTSIKFINFKENPTDKPHTFHYPFGRYDFTDKPRGLMDWFIYKARNPDTPCENFAEFYHDMVMMSEANKLTKNEDSRIRGFDFRSDTAYHMDATMFGIYLRDNICKPAGLTHILATVTGASQAEDGSISVIHTEEHRDLTADLFVDCTGFRSLLLEQTLGEEFVSFHDTLLNDRAIATVMPYIDRDQEMECVTSCTAIEAGWVWNIPLWNRIGTGYVYSSKFATESAAEEQFRNHLKSNVMVCPDSDRAGAVEFKHIKIKHGVHKHAWSHNVVGIGLANGFIEPLESTGLMLAHEGIMKLVQALQMRDGHVTKYEIDSFNFAFYEQIMGFKDFISLHYGLSMRNDTPYWKHVSEKITYSQAMIDFVPSVVNAYAELAYKHYRSHVYGTDMSGIVYIAAGMGYNPVTRTKVDFLDIGYNENPGYEKEVYNKWLEHKQEVTRVIEQLPNHREFLEKTIYNE
jgi:tryptophan halogenase